MQSDYHSRLPAVTPGNYLGARTNFRWLSAKRMVRQALPTIAILFGWFLGTRNAAAHVKWFAPYNIAAAPTPLTDMASGTFLFMLVASVMLVGIVYICDRIAEQTLPANFFTPIAALAPHSANIMRIALGAFMVSLWAKGGAILTPELKTDSMGVGFIQLITAVCTLTWRTTWISSFCLVVLYIISMANYGVFHLLDYPLFLGIAAYLAIISLKIERLQPYALSILYAAMSGTLLWASIEKWAFAAWTMPLLTQYERITLGFDHSTYMIIAGFVEFGAAFLLLYGRTSQRLAAVLLFFIFAAAIIEFGKLDAIGHAMIMTSLIIVTINGNTSINRFLQNKISSRSIGAFEAGISYLGCLLFFFIIYYTAHGIIYDSWA